MSDTAPTTLDRRDSFLFIVDVQERLAPAIEGADTVIANADRLIRAARRLDVPVVASEQYTKGLGHTVPALRSHLDPAERLEKTTFDATREPELRGHLAGLDRDQAVILGTEAHVCVLQTALGCLGMGIVPWVVADAVGSRAPANRDLALARMSRAGAGIVSTEMVLFEWLERAGTEDFRALLPLIR
jgi:nicotinamidase-related amidase